VLLFVVTFPWENQENPGADDWLVVVAFVMMGAAARFFLGVIARFAWLAAPAFVVGAVAGSLALNYGLVEWSDHGDEKLLTFAALVGASGVVAVALTVRSARELQGAGPETHSARL